MSDLTETEKEKAKKYYPLPELAEKARVPNMDAYFEKWKYSVENIEEFWAEEAKKIDSEDDKQTSGLAKEKKGEQLDEEPVTDEEEIE